MHVYKGYEIVPAPEQLESGEWTIRVYIILDRRDETVRTFYTANGTADSEKEAIKRSIEFGKQIIDGNFPEFTLPE